jgi:hypothetical protein
MTYGLYLYGIFPPPGPTQLVLNGLDDQPVNTYQLDEFVFLYSDAQQKRYRSSRRNLFGHEQVLEQMMEQGFRTLLPLQFGLVIKDWEAVRDKLITPYGGQLQTMLQRLEGQREVGVKVFWDTNAELQALLAENDELRAERDRLEGRTLSMEEVVRIGQAIEHAMETRKQAVIHKFQTVLNRLATQVVENAPMDEAMIYNSAYLIPWNAEERFSEAVEQLDQQFENRLRIRYNNFTAPFNFAQLQAAA